MYVVFFLLARTEEVPSAVTRPPFLGVFSIASEQVRIVWTKGKAGSQYEMNTHTQSYAVIGKLYLWSRINTPDASYCEPALIYGLVCP